MQSLINTPNWLARSKWMFVGGSTIAAIVALVAEGPGEFIGLGCLLFCVAIICSWSLISKPSLQWVVILVSAALLALAWAVEDPEPALFQSVLLAAAVGWKIDRLAVSLGLLSVLVLLPMAGSMGQWGADWGWWNWSVGTMFTWVLGRVIRLLDQTLIALTDARAQLIDSAAKEERLRISRDVHDLVGHSLTAMLLNIRAAARDLDDNPVEAHQALADAEKIGTTGMLDIRAALIDIRSTKNDSIGTEQALNSPPDGEAILRLLKAQAHIKSSVEGDVGSLNGALAIAVYRILQECITNCSRYALAGTASIRLRAGDDEIELFSQNALVTNVVSRPANPEPSLGLISMRERVVTLGGSFTAGVESNLWQVRCRIPRHA